MAIVQPKKQSESDERRDNLVKGLLQRLQELDPFAYGLIGNVLIKRASDHIANLEEELEESKQGRCKNRAHELKMQFKGSKARVRDVSVVEHQIKLWTCIGEIAALLCDLERENFASQAAEYFKQQQT